MQFVYCYKSSDGIRHEDEIAAPSREAAFEALRAKGIRPIKVYAKDGSVANGSDVERQQNLRRRHRLVRHLVELVVVVGLAVGAFFSSDIGKFVENQTRSGTLRAIELRAEAMSSAFEADWKTSGADLLSDSSLLVRSGSSTNIEEIVASVKSVVSAWREEVRQVFADLYAEFPSPDKGEELVEAQKRYDELMRLIDAREVSLVNLYFAFVELDRNRSGWRLRENGEIEFLDAKLKARYDYCKRGVSIDPSGARWRKDFGKIADEDF